MLALVDNIKRENRRLINQGRREGRRAGKKQGRKEAQIEIIKAMQKNNFTIEQIIKITGLSEEEIEKI